MDLKLLYIPFIWRLLQRLSLVGFNMRNSRGNNYEWRSSFIWWRSL
jgi:hypothetical protein